MTSLSAKTIFISAPFITQVPDRAALSLSSFLSSAGSAVAQTSTPTAASSRAPPDAPPGRGPRPWGAVSHRRAPRAPGERCKAPHRLCDGRDAAQLVPSSTMIGLGYLRLETEPQIRLDRAKPEVLGREVGV